MDDPSESKPFREIIYADETMRSVFVTACHEVSHYLALPEGAPPATLAVTLVDDERGAGVTGLCELEDDFEIESDEIVALFGLSGPVGSIIAEGWLNQEGIIIPNTDIALRLQEKWLEAGELGYSESDRKFIGAMVDDGAINPEICEKAINLVKSKWHSVLKVAISFCRQFDESGGKLACELTLSQSDLDSILH